VWGSGRRGGVDPPNRSSPSPPFFRRRPSSTPTRVGFIMFYLSLFVLGEMFSLFFPPPPPILSGCIIFVLFSFIVLSYSIFSLFCFFILFPQARALSYLPCRLVPYIFLYTSCLPGIFLPRFVSCYLWSHAQRPNSLLSAKEQFGRDSRFHKLLFPLGC